MPVTPLPPAPRATNLGTFSTLADNFFTALPGMVTEINALPPAWVFSSFVDATGVSAIDFTSIPAGVKEISVLFDHLLPASTDQILVQVGTSAGLITAGYDARAQYATASTLATSATSTSGFKLHGVVAYSAVGAMQIFPANLSTLCICDARVGLVGASLDYTNFTSGVVSLPGNIDRIRVTRVGASNFTSGSVGIGWRA